MSNSGVVRPMLNLVCLTTPPPTSPDITSAHNCVNYSVVSARYRRAFCVMLWLRPWYQRIYSLYSEVHLEGMGFGKSEILKRSAAYT